LSKRTITKEELKSALQKLGIEKGMTLEVHSSLSSFGELEGGAETVIDTLKELVTEEGSIFMPAGAYGDDFGHQGSEMTV